MEELKRSYAESSLHTISIEAELFALLFCILYMVCCLLRNNHNANIFVLLIYTSV